MPKCPSKACGCAVITLWIIINVLILIITCVNYLVPYIRIAMYEQATCRIEAYFYTTQFVCSCGQWCHSTYPCVVVHVSVNVSTDEMWVLSLYEDDVQQRWVNQADTDEQEMCSYYVCHSESSFNRMKVDQFAARYKDDIGGFITCFYNPFRLTEGAVLKVKWPGLEVFHAVFWPALFICVGVLACVFFCKWCRRRELMSADADGDQTEGKALTEQQVEKKKKDLEREKAEEAKRQKKLEQKKLKEEKRREKERIKYELHVKKSQEKAARLKAKQQKREETVFHVENASDIDSEEDHIQVVIKDGKLDQVGKWS